MNSPKVSVIITVYNAERYLRKCLDSIVNQTLKDIEIICVDDQSSDKSLSILEEYAKKDNRIRVLTQDNAGAGAARNLGIRCAKGEYLSILDSDDFFELNMLEKAYLQAKTDNSDMVVFSCDFYDDTERAFSPCDYSIRQSLLPEARPFSALDVKKDVFRLFIGWAWDKLFRTRLVHEYRLEFQEQRTTNDMLFVFCALIYAQRISVMVDVLAHYRRSPGSLSVTREKSWHCFYDALLSLRTELKKAGLFERFERDFCNYCLNLSLWHLNTLKEPSYTLLYNKLREEWYEELGVTNHPREYYYNQQEYSQYQSICKHPVGWKPSLQEMPKMKRLKNGCIILRGWNCLIKNGFKYTINRVINKVFDRRG